MKELTNQLEGIPIFNPFAGPVINRVIYTTQPQAEIWTACKLGDIDANRAYNESVSLILKGNLNKNALLKAIESLVERHEALRSVFSTDGRFMTIFKNLSIAIDHQDIAELSAAEKEKTLKDYLALNANYVFDLVKGPLFKVGLIKISETEHHLILTAHHIICDGWSTGIMLEELGSLYSAAVLNKTPQLPKPESFCAYADEQQAFLVSEVLKTNETYWRHQFSDAVPQVTLPTDFPRPPLRTFKSARFDAVLETSLIEALKKTGVKFGCSFVTTLLTAFEVFLYTQTGHEDGIVGLPSADQAASGKTQMIGHCVNLLPLRSKIDANMRFSNYLKQRKTQLFDAYEHQRFSFGQLLQKLAIARDPSRVPLVPVVFNIDMGMSSAVSFTNLEYQLKSNPRAYEAFELFLNATGSEKELILEWSYSSNLFKPETIKKMMTSFEEVLTKIIENPDIEIGDIIKIDPTDYLALNNTKVAYPQVPLHQLIAKQAQLSPEKLALKFGASTITYKDLEKQVNQLAHCLTDQGVKPGAIIGVALPRSTELVVTLLAIMQCGAAYLPLDPSYPKQRLDFMIEDSQAEVLILSNELKLSIESLPKVLVIEALFSNLKNYPATQQTTVINLDAMVYLLYTSGSTGKPKGVQVSHKNLVNFLYGMLQVPDIEETDKLLSITTISFDIAGLELFLPLLKGATLVIANDETAKDPRVMLEVIKEEKITVLQATPTTWHMLIDSGFETRLPIKALCGGEALPMSLATKLLERVDELWNMYGPTETTIWSAVKQIKPEDKLITIGKPIANTQLYILNENGQLVKSGGIGELCIAGDGVAKGYWNRPDLTAEKFVKNTLDAAENAKLYKTGDLAKLLPTGEVQCLGRIDQQVKIRGHRIELGEIEEALNKLNGVETSAVSVNHDRLVAYILSKQGASNLDTSNWKLVLAEQLPAYMVPQDFYFLKEFPTTLNGKIDRKALSNSSTQNNKKQDFNAPQTASEKIIATIWETCLEIDKIDVYSDFFEMGGHSLIAVKVMTLLEKQTGVRLPLAALLEHPTINQLATYLDKNNIKWDSLVPLNPTGNKPPLFIVHGANYNVLIFKTLADCLDEDQPVYALQAKGLNGEVEPHNSVEAMAAHYISEIKTVNPHGPYALGGFSFGGIIAFEMAKQLKAEGKKVKTIALFDSYVYPHYYYSNLLVKNIISKLYSVGHLIFMGFNMFSSVKNFKRRYGLLKIKTYGWYLVMRYGSETQNQLQFNRTSKIDEYHDLASMKYHLIPQNIKVALFRSSENIYFTHDYNLLGWKKIASGGIKKYMMPGNHSELFLSPVVEVLGSSLQQVLDTDDAAS